MSDFASDRLSMKSHAPTAAATMNGSQMSPAYARCTSCTGSFTAAAGTPTMTTSGTISCVSATPRLPPAAFSPSARPFLPSG